MLAQLLFYLGFFIAMSYRFTNTEKWTDSWFSNLKQLEMLLFLYLCDNCDIAGFIEINYKRWANDLNSSVDTIQGACKGLARGLTYSDTNDCIYINNFLKHQKNLPLNENNKAHLGIIKRFKLYSLKFNIQDINEFIQGASKGLQSPTGNGIGIGIDNKDTIKEKTWKTDYNIYLQECINAHDKIVKDEKWIKLQQDLNPNVNIFKSIRKGFEQFWSTEAGWQNKKKAKIDNINWKSTIMTSIEKNKTYYTKEELEALKK